MIETQEEKVARDFVAALMAATPDEALYESWATGQHNFDAGPGPLQDGFKSMELIRGFVPDFRFDDLRVHPSPGACTLQYVIRGTLPDGVRLEAPACIVLTFSDTGKVATLEEYLDPGQLSGLSRLMSGVGAEGSATGAS
jgi:hypothetical protein